MTGTMRKRRWNWRKLLAYVILGYLGVWFSHSLIQYFNLSHQEAVIRSQIQVARARNRQLAHDLADLNNPAYVKRMVLGQVVTPRPNLNGISAAQRPS